MAGLPLGEPPLRAAEGGSDRTKGVYQAIEHEPLAGDDTKNGVETSRGAQATLSVPKYQWNPTQIGAEVESEGREIFAQQIHRCHMGWLLHLDVLDLGRRSDALTEPRVLACN